MIENWLGSQEAKSNTRWEEIIKDNYSDQYETWTNAEKYFHVAETQYNYLEAARLIDWNKFVQKDSTVVDLGCGTGWLAAYLSGLKIFKSIYCIDKSEYLVRNMVPKIISLYNGDPEIIHSIIGNFYPLMFEDDSIDNIAISSSIHHVDNFPFLIKEISRVLKKNGKLFILNEQFPSSTFYLYQIIRFFISVLRKQLLRVYAPISPSLSYNFFLYDPLLGDKTYPLWFLKKCLESHGLIIELVMKTPFYPYKNNKNGIQLSHLVCKKV